MTTPTAEAPQGYCQVTCARCFASPTPVQTQAAPPAVPQPPPAPLGTPPSPVNLQVSSFLATWCGSMMATTVASTIISTCQHEVNQCLPKSGHGRSLYAAYHLTRHRHVHCYAVHACFVPSNVKPSQVNLTLCRRSVYLELSLWVPCSVLTAWYTTSQLGPNPYAICATAHGPIALLTLHSLVSAGREITKQTITQLYPIRHPTRGFSSHHP